MMGMEKRRVVHDEKLVYPCTELINESRLHANTRAQQLSSQQMNTGMQLQNLQFKHSRKLITRSLRCRPAVIPAALLVLDYHGPAATIPVRRNSRASASLVRIVRTSWDSCGSLFVWDAVSNRNQMQNQIKQNKPQDRSSLSQTTAVVLCQKSC